MSRWLIFSLCCVLQKRELKLFLIPGPSLILRNKITRNENRAFGHLGRSIRRNEAVL